MHLSPTTNVKLHATEILVNLLRAVLFKPLFTFLKSAINRVFNIRRV